MSEPVSVRRCLRAAALGGRRLSARSEQNANRAAGASDLHVVSADLQRDLDPAWTPVSSRGIVVPAQLYASTVEILGEMNVGVLPREAPAIPAMTVFLIDEDDYIVVQDFVVDVPEFTHKPEWFAPFVPNAAG